MPKISELSTDTPTGANLLAVAQGAQTIKATINEVIKAGPVATAAVNGLMSSGDKSKLDNLGGTGASVTVDSTAPTNPGDGDLWYDTSVMELYVYVDAESSWVQTNGGGGGSDGDWESVTRVIDDTTIYTNDTGGLIFGNLAVGRNSADSLGVAIEITLNGVVTTIQVATGTNSGGGQSVAGQYMVPPGATYKFTATGRSITGAGLSTPTFHEMVVSSGGGGGPRAYVAFNPTDGAATTTASEPVFPEIYNQYNISSITDKGYFTQNGNQTGYRWTINLTSPVSNPIINISADGTSETVVYSGSTVPGSSTEWWNKLNTGYHIEDDSTIHVFIVNSSGTGLPEDGFKHMSVTIH